MQKIKRIVKKIGIYLWKPIFFLGLTLLVANIMRLFFNRIVLIPANIYEIFRAEEDSYLSSDKVDVVASNFKDMPQDELFLKDCELGADGANGKYLHYINKICIKKQHWEVLNHEMVHYSLRNRGIVDKMFMVVLIRHFIDNIQYAVKYIHDMDLKTADDRHFFAILQQIHKHAQDPDYTFYEVVDVAVFYHRGNEEYITYAIGPLLYMSDDDKLKIKEFDLENEKLQKIYSKYKSAYSYILEDFEES